MNRWITVSRCRRIADDLKQQFLGKFYHTPCDERLDYVIFDAMYRHPLHEEAMWAVMSWDEDDCLTDVEIRILTKNGTFE